MTLDEVAERFNAKRSGSGYKAICPVHDDNIESVSINQDGEKILLMCHAGCPTDAVLDKVGLTFTDLFLTSRPQKSAAIAEYFYRDEHGTLLYRKQRKANKEFYFAKADGKGGWITSKEQNGGKPVMEGVQRVVYRLNDLREASENSSHETFCVYIAEGEKDVDRLWREHLPATTNDGGAKTWPSYCVEQLKSIGVTHVVVFGDNDDAGRAHVADVARNCAAAGMDVRIVDLPGLQPSGDVSDYLAAGHTDLADRIAAASRYDPARVIDAGPESTSDPDSLEDLDAFLDRIDKLPDLSWRLEGLVPDEGFTLMHGQPRGLKTISALEMALAMAMGRWAFGAARFAAPRPCKVTYFAEEDGERLFAARLKWLIRKNGRPAKGMFFLRIRKSWYFDTEDGKKAIYDYIVKTQSEVAFFDSLRSFTGMSDKGPADLRPVVEFLRGEIQNTTTAKSTVLVHHDTKPTQRHDDMSRSQQASGGGIFSISDCPISFEKVAWNQVAVYPENYKLCGDPDPFEVTFETDEWTDDNGAPRFGPREAPWVRPMAETKKEVDIKSETDARKILAFLGSHRGEWFNTGEVNTGAKIRNDAAGPVLKRLRDQQPAQVRFCTGEEAVEHGAKSKSAHLWSALDAETLGMFER